MTESIARKLRVAKGKKEFYFGLMPGLAGPRQGDCVELGLGLLPHRACQLSDGSQVFTVPREQFGATQEEQDYRVIEKAEELAECIGNVTLQGSLRTLGPDCTTLFPEASTNLQP